MNGFGSSAEAQNGRRILFAEADCATLHYLFVDRGTVIPRHHHQTPSLIYGLGGPCLENGQLITRKLTYRPALYEHDLQFTGGTNLFLIELLPSGSGQTWPDRPLALPATLYAPLWRVFLRVAHYDRKELGKAFSHLFEEVLDFAAVRQPSWLEQVVDDLHANWLTVPSVRVLSRKFLISPQHLSFTFKRLIGITIQQYGLALRLDYARNLLWGTGMPIADIAAASGFADQSHLTRSLRSSFNSTPRKFRQMGPASTYDAIRFLPSEARLAFIEDLIRPSLSQRA